jgi:hypothetical protein
MSDTARMIYAASVRQLNGVIAERDALRELQAGYPSGTLFYFVATRPDLVKAVGDKIYLTYAEADDARAFVSGLLRTPFRVYQAAAVNIVLAEE